MTQESRRQLLMKAVRDAAIELATRVDRARYATAPLDNNKPTPDELLVMAAPMESATKGPYLDDKRPTPDEIRAFTISTSPPQMSFGPPSPSILLTEPGMRA